MSNCPIYYLECGEYKAMYSSKLCSVDKNMLQKQQQNPWPAKFGRL